MIIDKKKKFPTFPQFTIIPFLGNPPLRDDKSDRLHHGEISLQNSGSHQHFLKGYSKCLKREHAGNFVNFQTVYFILILRDNSDADDNGDDC